MKIITFILLLILASSNLYSQSRLEEVKDEKLLNIITKIDSSIIIKSNQFFISIVRINNGSGSAGLAESDEASHSFYLTVSEYDENPNSKLFLLGPFINPKFISKEDLEEKYIIHMEQGVVNKRSGSKLLITKSGVKLE